MEKKYKLKTDGQPISMPCTPEQWKQYQTMLGEIDGAQIAPYDGDFIQMVIVNNADGVYGKVAIIDEEQCFCYSRQRVSSAPNILIESLRGELIEKEVKEVKQESPFNDEYWERLYHECALRLWVNKHALYFTEDAIKDAKMLIEELKNNPLKQKYYLNAEHEMHD